MEKSLKQAAAELNYFVEETYPVDIKPDYPAKREHEFSEYFFHNWKKAEYFIKNLDAYEIGIFGFFAKYTDASGDTYLSYNSSAMLLKKKGRNTVYKLKRSLKGGMYSIGPIPAGLSKEEAYALVNMHAGAGGVKRPSRMGELSFTEKKIDAWMDYADACYAAVKRDADEDAMNRDASMRTIADFSASLPDSSYEKRENEGSHYSLHIVETPRFCVTFTLAHSGRLSHTVVYKSTLAEIARMENALVLTLNK